MAKIIMAAPPIPGELMPLLQIARGLEERGHQVTMLTGTGLRGMVEQAGLKFEALSGAADYDIREHMAERDRAGIEPGPEQLSYDFIHAFINPMPDEHRALQALLEADPDQYLIANTLFLGGWPVRYGAPGRAPLGWVSVSAVPLVMTSESTTFFGPVPVEPGQDPKAANRAANDGFVAAIRPADDRVAELLGELGADRAADAFIDAIYTTADHTAVLTVPGFEFARTDQPENVHLVGILPPGTPEDWQPPAWWAELDGSRPVVLVTQGTITNGDLSQLVEPTLRALADADVTVIAALGRDPEALSMKIPANAHVVEFIPFAALLPKIDVYVSNGGFGGTQQAVAAGVPVVVAGETEDKAGNAARVAYHGLGINLQTATPTPEAVAGAVARLLDDSEIHENVTGLAKVYAQYDALDTIEHLLLG